MRSPIARLPRPGSQVNLSKWPPAPERGDRTAQPMADFYEPWNRVNTQLAAVGAEELVEGSFIGLRLYTGPMYIKCAKGAAAASNWRGANRTRALAHATHTHTHRSVTL